MWTPSERRWLALAIAVIALALVAALAWVNEPRQPASAVRIEPAAERHCEIGVMRWHWLCDRGE